MTYGLNLNARLSRWILSFCKLENKIISIERIHQYCQIPSEAPAVIEDSRPPPSWPNNGKIELINLKVSKPYTFLFALITKNYIRFDDAAFSYPFYDRFVIRRAYLWFCME